MRMIARVKVTTGQIYDPAKMQAALVAGGTDIVGHIRDNLISGQVLTPRTGNLRRRVFSTVTKRGTGWVLRVGVHGVPYAAIHEMGGVVKAKSGKWLTIPLEGAKTAVGVTRGKARSFKNTFFLKTKSGNLFIMQNPKKKGKAPIPLFLLRKSVVIPRRSYVLRGTQERIGQVLQRIGEVFK